MKTICLLFALGLLSLTAHAQSPTVTFKGGILSTVAPWPHGGDWVMDLSSNGYFVATTSIDCIQYGLFTGVVDAQGHLAGRSSAGHTITGRVAVKNGHTIFTGRIRGFGLTYKVQAVVGVFN